eukprot:2617590-Rhodomonas_salina.1
MNDVDYKLDEKDAAFDKFNGDPHANFEKLIVVTSELTDLGIAEEVTRDLKRAGNAIFRFAIREGATEMDKEWKDWLRTHKKVMKTQGKADSLKEMQKSAKEHLEEMK